MGRAATSSVSWRPRPHRARRVISYYDICRCAAGLLKPAKPGSLGVSPKRAQRSRTRIRRHVTESEANRAINRRLLSRPLEQPSARKGGPRLFAARVDRVWGETSPYRLTGPGAPCAGDAPEHGARDPFAARPRNGIAPDHDVREFRVERLAQPPAPAVQVSLHGFLP
jgi:hypothetical protein